jgi:hypothetical protein
VAALTVVFTCLERREKCCSLDILLENKNMAVNRDTSAVIKKGALASRVPRFHESDVEDNSVLRDGVSGQFLRLSMIKCIYI